MITWGDHLISKVNDIKRWGVEEKPGNFEKRNITIRNHFVVKIWHEIKKSVLNEIIKLG